MRRCTDSCRFPTHAIRWIGISAIAIWLPLVSTGSIAAAGVPALASLTGFDLEWEMTTDGGRGPYRLSPRRIDKDSEMVWVGGTRQEHDRDYTIDYEGALLTFFQEVPRGRKVVVRFRQPPQVLQPVYRRRAPPGSKIAEFESPAYGPRFPDLRRVEDGPSLDVGGAKRIQVAFGSNRHHSLSQSLNLHVSGALSEGVEVLALLSDQNLPLEPTGRTRSIQELERVFLQVRSPSVSAGLGDLEVAFEGSRFGRYRRTLQGARISLSRAAGDLTVFGAVDRGRRVTTRLLPEEGYQGPYRLEGGTGQIVPGSERVYLDGRPMRRGETQDYRIDYDRGTLIFTPARPITSASRISVEYQFLADGLRRRLMGLHGRAHVADDRLALGTTLIRESDQGAPGISAPGAPLLSHQVMVLDGAFQPAPAFRVDGEIALSDRLIPESAPGTRRDQALQVGFDWVPGGTAGVASGGQVPTRSRWRSGQRTGGPRGPGEVQLTGSFRQVGPEFKGFEPVDRVVRDGRWGWQSESEVGGHRQGELSLAYRYGKGIRLDAGLGKRTGTSGVERSEIGIGLYSDGLAELDYRLERIGRAGGRLLRHRGRLAGFWRALQPSVRFESETATGEGVQMSSVYYAGIPGGRARPEGIRRGALTWDLSAATEGVWNWQTTLVQRFTEQLSSAWQDSVRGWTWTQRVGLLNWKGLHLRGEYSRNAVRSVDQSRSRTTHLSRLQIGYQRPGGGLSHQLSYRISSTGAPDRDPVYVEVDRGMGTYIWEDVNGDGFRDPREFIPDVDGNYEVFANPVSAFTPARDGAVGIRFESDLRRLWPNRRWRGLALDFSLEADRQAVPGAVGVTPWDLLAFRSGPDILGGRRDLRLKLYFFRYHRAGSVTLFARNRDRVDSLYPSGGPESLSELSAVGRIRKGNRVDLEVLGRMGRKHRPGSDAFAYAIQSRFGSGRWIWRPSRGWQIRLGAGLGRDTEARRTLRADFTSLESEIVRALPGLGRIRGSLDWVGVAATGPLPLYLGMAEGNREGQNTIWRLGVDFRLGKHITALVGYDGRSRADRPTVHMGRAEVRAIF